jgi:Flp pilus assembly pilin Flp
MSRHRYRLGGENDMQNILKCLWRDEQGQDLTEYALLLILIGLVGTASMAKIGQTVSSVFSNAAANLTT